MENTNYTGKMSRPVRYGKRQTADEDDFVWPPLLS